MLAVECKNLRQSHPLLVSAVPRTLGEAFHDVGVYEVSQAFRAASIRRVVGNHSAYKAFLALDCERHGLAAKSLDKGLWASHMTEEALYDEHWLLAYEANVKGWLPSVGGGDHVTADVNFGFLKKTNVHFYEGGLASAPPATPIPLPVLPTVSMHTAHTDHERVEHL